jgi:fumarate reductase subunit C
MLNARMYLLQRISALIMAPLVLLHLAVMIVAIQGGLDSAEILSRTSGSLFWGSVYGLFVVTVSIHAALGLRVVMFEWLRIRGDALNGLSWFAFVVLLAIGIRAVIAVVTT